MSSTEAMSAWAVTDPGPIATHPLARVERPVPDPGRGEIRISVRACGVCRTDLHLAEGDLAEHRNSCVPGHEVVGVVDALGPATGRFKIGERIGIAWLARTCGVCRFCRGRRENLCLTPRFTGWDLDGGYAPYAVVAENFAYSIPSEFTDERAAPLLCAGIIGYRAFRACALPIGGRLGIYGFGGSAHLTAQIALADGARVHVLTRGESHREFAQSLEVASVGTERAAPPEPLDAAILFAPAGDLVPRALAALDRGGVLVVAGIHMSNVPALHYQAHLFYERVLRSVTANTREDGVAFLQRAAEIDIAVTTRAFTFNEANLALRELALGRVNGAGVIVFDPN